MAQIWRCRRIYLVECLCNVGVFFLFSFADMPWPLVHVNVTWACRVWRSSWLATQMVLPIGPR